MAAVITYDRLQVDCNIALKEIRGLTIHARPNEHAVATIDAVLSLSQSGVIAEKLSAQPISISTKGPDGKTLFYGVIGDALLGRDADFVTLHIQAYSLSWFLDLEQKSRSFQKTEQNYEATVSDILADYDADAIYNITDKAIGKPYIQYQETDWEFIRRVASRLGAPIIPAMQLERTGLYVGFPSKGGADVINTPTYRVGLDDRYRQWPDGDKRQYLYYEIKDYTPRLIGDPVSFRGEALYVSAVDAALRENELYYTYRLASPDYNRVLPIYNQALCGLSLIGTVLDRKAELLRLHLAIDEEQDKDTAYFYTWLPESGNIMYNMPELETKVSLYMQSADEQSAICVDNVRENGSACGQTQEPSQRYLMTEGKKSLSMKPETIEQTTLATGTTFRIDDNFGCLFNSRGEMLIQAGGNLTIRGGKLDMSAPKEVTTVRRKLGAPSVLNLCNNVDTIGGFGKFQATGKYTKSSKGGGHLTTYAAKSGEADKQALEKRRKKLKFKLAELLKKSEVKEYDLSDTYRSVLSAIPQHSEVDAVARLSVGTRVLYSTYVADRSMIKEDEGEKINVNGGGEQGDWSKSLDQSYQQNAIREGDKGYFRFDAGGSKAE